MEETMKKLVDGVLVVLNNASDFISKETPDVIRQYLQYVSIDLKIDIYYSIFWLIFFFVLYLVIWGIYYKKVHNNNDIHKVDRIGVFGCMVFLFVILGIPFSFTFSDLKNDYKKLLQLEASPKIYLIKDAAKLLQK